MTLLPDIPSDVEMTFQRFSPEHREVLLQLRALIFDVAGGDSRIGPLEEVLRWGEPAYLPVQKKTGSTIRLGVEKVTGRPALFFNCKTTLVEEFRAQFGGVFQYSKNRAVLVDDVEGAARQALLLCIAAALTYHLR